MANISNFLKDKMKYIILAIFLIVIVVIILLIQNKSTSEIDVYKDIKYNYFVMYSKENKVGVIDQKGNIILEPNYIDVYIPNPEKDVFFCYSSDIEYVILNSKGEKLFENYEDVSCIQTSEDSLDFKKYVLRFKKDGKHGLIDFDGNIVLEASYDSLESLNYKPGEILVKKDGKYGVVSSNGEIKIKIEYDSISGDEFYQESNSYNDTGYIVGNKMDAGYLYGYLNSKR